MSASMIAIPIMLNPAFAPSQTQIWTEAENNAEIVFTYSNPCKYPDYTYVISIPINIPDVAPKRAISNASEKKKNRINMDLAPIASISIISFTLSLTDV
jgi:hypothetical protein